MASAGMASIYAAQLPSTTYEGDNFILNQQVCRAAVKDYEAKKAREDLQLSSQTRVSRTIEKFGGDMGKEASALLDVRAGVVVGRLAKRKAVTSSWTDLSWECVPVATAVTEATISRQILSAVSKDARPAEAAILKKVYTLVSFIC
jgi:acyl-CoA oxidase